MKFVAKILLIVTLVCLPTLAFPQKGRTALDDEKQTVELTINGEKFVVDNLPQEGIIEIFNILGSKVMSFSVKDGVNITRINLPEGYYILKGDNNVTRKIVVK